MNGFVDKNRKAFLPVEVRASFKKNGIVVEAWVDTAFDGHFVFSENLIKELELDTLVETEAVLADGSRVVLPTYVCYLDWFGEKIAAQVIANEGKFSLLGTALLADRNLKIIFKHRTLELE